MSGLLYVPILKTKRNEFLALCELSEEVKKHIKPMFQMTSEKAHDRCISLSKNIDNNWKDKPFYIDLNLDRPILIEGSDYQTYVIEKLIQSEAKFTLVMDVKKSNNTLINLANKYNLLICFKIDVAYFDDNTLSDLDQLITKTNSAAGSCDILINFSSDVKSTGTAHANYIEQYYSLVNNYKPNFFKHVIISASSIPNELPRDNFNPYGLEPRIEWMGFVLFATKHANTSGSRVFSDYSTSHPDEAEAQGYVNPNAKIRYTISENYVFAIGYQVYTHDDGFGQYHDMANIIVNSPYYMGKDYSWGDKYIYDCSTKNTGTGNMGTWVKVGHNHHITFTTHQIANRSVFSI